MTEKMKKTLNWKLKEAPTGSEIAELVKQKIITAEEGREMLFGSREYDYEKMKALEEQVEFLRELVKDLSKNRTNWSGFTYTKPTIYYNTPYWIKTQGLLDGVGWMSTSSADGTLSVSNKA